MLDGARISDARPRGRQRAKDLVTEWVAWLRQVGGASWRNAAKGFRETGSNAAEAFRATLPRSHERDMGYATAVRCQKSQTVFQWI